MKAKVYQWIFDEYDLYEVNLNGWSSDIGILYMEATIFPSVKGVKAAEDKYFHTMTIDLAEDRPLSKLTDQERSNLLEDVYHIGNIGPEDQIRRHGIATSVSTGNVVEIEGRYFIVANVGFDEIENFNPGN